jgi:glycosyltransferase involved in cell wall biosynthesis
MNIASISIALPVYNGANYLRQALDSICAQTCTDFEIVVSDNASTDETPIILEEFARRDPRIRVSRSERLLGHADNCSRAAALCSRDWIKFFCHDDLMAPQCMARIKKVASECPPQVGLIGNGEQWLFANGYCYRQPVASCRSENWEGRQLIRARLLRGHTSLAPLPSLTTATVRRAAWQACGGFDSRFVHHFDAFLWTILLMEWDYIYTPEVLTTNRVHKAQVAVSARKSLRSVDDHRLFWREFVGKYGDTLGLGRWSRLLLRSRWLGWAGLAVAVPILRGDLPKAAAVFVRTPIAGWPLLPAFVVRSYRYEKRRIATLVGHVPVSEIYPA